MSAQQHVEQISDGVTAASGFQASNLASQIWNWLKSDTKAPPSNAQVKSGETVGGTAESGGETEDKVKSGEAAGKVNPSENRGENRKLLDGFDEQAKKSATEFSNAPIMRNLTPEFHSMHQQIISNADNLPFDSIRGDRDSLFKQYGTLNSQIETAGSELLRGSHRSPELKELVPWMIEHLGKPGYSYRNDGGLERLRQIAPDLADAFDSRTFLVRQSQSIANGIARSDRLLNMPISTRSQYAKDLDEAGGPETDKAAELHKQIEKLRAAPNTVAGKSTDASASVPSVPPHAISDAAIKAGNDATIDRHNDLLRSFEFQRNDAARELQKSPPFRALTSEFHVANQQMIKDADNLPFGKIEVQRRNMQNEAPDVRKQMNDAEMALVQGAQHQPELRKMIWGMLDSIDTDQFDSAQGKNLDALRRFDPDLADTVETRRALGKHSRELKSGITDADRLLEMPIATRLRYVNDMVNAGGAEVAKAVEVLADVVSRFPQASRARVSTSNNGTTTMEELITRSNALASKGFVHVYRGAGYNPDAKRESAMPPFSLYDLYSR